MLKLRNFNFSTVKLGTWFRVAIRLNGAHRPVREWPTLSAISKIDAAVARTSIVCFATLREREHCSPGSWKRRLANRFAHEQILQCLLPRRNLNYLKTAGKQIGEHMLECVAARNAHDDARTPTLDIET